MKATRGYKKYTGMRKFGGPEWNLDPGHLASKDTLGEFEKQLLELLEKRGELKVAEVRQIMGCSHDELNVGLLKLSRIEGVRVYEDKIGSYRVIGLI